MSAISTSLADSTDKRVSDLIEASFMNDKLPNESQPLTRMSSAARNFGNVGALFHGFNSSGDGAVFKDCAVLDASSPAVKQFYDRGAEYLKCDAVSWEDFAKVQRTNVARSESLSLSSATGAFKFIKDEKEPSVIMDTPCPNFDPSSAMPAIDTCCDTDRKLVLTDGESTGFTPAAAGSPNFLLELNQVEQLPALSQVRTDSRSCLSGKAVVGFDADTNTGQQLTAYKSEAPRWQTQTSPAEPQYWCQSAGGTEELFAHGSFEGFQTPALTHRNPSPYSAFPG